jgi:hypothetical protein
MEVRIVALDAIGDRKRGEIFVENVYKARQYVDHGKACYYADFTESMLEEEDSSSSPKKKASKKD